MNYWSHVTLMLLSLPTLGVTNVYAVGRQRNRQQHILSMNQSTTPHDTCTPSFLTQPSEVSSFPTKEKSIQEDSNLVKQHENLKIGKYKEQVLDEDEDAYFHVLNDPPYMGPLEKTEDYYKTSRDRFNSKANIFDKLIDFFASLGDVHDFSTSFMELLGNSATTMAKAQVGSWNRITGAILNPESQAKVNHSAIQNRRNGVSKDEQLVIMNEDETSTVSRSPVDSVPIEKLKDFWNEWRSWLSRNTKNFFDRLDKRIEEAGGHIMLMDLYDAPL